MKPISLWHTTIRGRLLMLTIGIELLMLTILVTNSLRLLHGAMTSQARSQAEQYYPVLGAALPPPGPARNCYPALSLIKTTTTHLYSI